MNIGILIFSEPRQEQHTGVDRLEEAALALGHRLVRLYEPSISIMTSPLTIRHNNEPLPDLDVIISRPSFIEEPSLRTYAVQQLVHAGHRVINSSPGYTWSKNKLTQHILFEEHDLPCPHWGIARKPKQALEIARQIGFPVIIKVAFGTHGKGVFYAENAETFLPIADYLAIRDGNPLIVEAFIQEAERKDVRAFLLGGKVIAAMERMAPENDIRANASTGGMGSTTTLTKEEQILTEQAAGAFDLEIAGVDFIRSANGPLLLEVNSNPGFKELERVTKQDIATQIITYAVQQVV